MSKAIDKHVRALLKLGVMPVLDYDQKLGVYILPVFIRKEQDLDSGRLDNRLEYQVSDGLPGQRASSRDEATYKEAKKAFREMCEEKRRKKPPCFSVLGAAWAPECKGGYSNVTNVMHRQPCDFFAECVVATQRNGNNIIQLRKKGTTR